MVQDRFSGVQVPFHTGAGWFPKEQADLQAGSQQFRLSKSKAKSLVCVRPPGQLGAVTLYCVRAGDQPLQMASALHLFY